MAWGSQGQVFLGEDLMHTRDYSDDTARVIDEEVERILRQAQESCREVLTENRNGLDLVARALLEHETIDGTEVSRLLELARAGSTSANPHNGTSVPRSPSGIEDVVDAPVDADVTEN
jgi:cell division protease FtsH